MQIKRKDPFKVCDEFSPITFSEYSSKVYRYTQKRIKKLYQIVFHKPCETNAVWAKHLIHYELARQQYIKNGQLSYLDKDSQFRKAYMAVKNQDINHVNENLKTLIPYELKHHDENSQENIMKQEKKVEAIKKAAEVKRTNRLGVTLGLSVPETWVRVFIANAKEHKSDAEISKFMHTEFPDLKNKAFDTVHGCRVHYNNGGYTKGVKPEVKSVRYADDGSELKRISKAPVAVAEQPKKVVAKKVVAKKAVVKKRLAKRA